MNVRVHCLLFSFVLSACTGMKTNSAPEHSAIPAPMIATKLVPATLKLRRPSGNEPDPQAGPGGLDYKRTEDVQDPECQTIAQALSAVDIPVVLKCFKTFKSPVIKNYRLIRGSEPYLELESEEDEPTCLTTSLKRIPLPREIVFVAPEPEPNHDKFRCLASRLDIEADQWMGFKLPKNRVALSLALPFKEPLETSDQFKRWYGGVVLAFFWDKSRGGIPSRIVTKRFCEACLGLKAMPDPEALGRGEQIIFWP